MPPYRYARRAGYRPRYSRFAPRRRLFQSRVARKAVRKAFRTKRKAWCRRVIPAGYVWKTIENNPAQGAKVPRPGYVAVAYADATGNKLSFVRATNMRALAAIANKSTTRPQAAGGPTTRGAASQAAAQAAIDSVLANRPQA